LAIIVSDKLVITSVHGLGMKGVLGKFKSHIGWRYGLQLELKKLRQSLLHKLILLG